MSLALVQAVAIPAAIAAVALSQLSPIWEDTVAAFFKLENNQQIAFMALLFAVIFGAVAFAMSLVGLASGNNNPNPFVACFRTPTTPDYPLAEIEKATTEKAKFEALFPMLKDQILEYLTTENELLSEASEWVDEMMEYSVPGGKLNRGTTVISVFQTLMRRDLTTYEIARAAVAGWTIEFLQAFFLVADDIMDDSQTRRGQVRKTMSLKSCYCDTVLLLAQKGTHHYDLPIIRSPAGTNSPKSS